MDSSQAERPFPSQYTSDTYRTLSSAMQAMWAEGLGPKCGWREKWTMVRAVSGSLPEEARGWWCQLFKSPRQVATASPLAKPAASGQGWLQRTLSYAISRGQLEVRWRRVDL